MLAVDNLSLTPSLQRLWLGYKESCRMWTSEKKAKDWIWGRMCRRREKRQKEEARGIGKPGFTVKGIQ